jgi:hypothetical protein
MSIKSNVYFISDGSYIKIGKANDVKSRIKDMQTGSAHKLTLLHYIKCMSEEEAFALETYLHDKYKDLHVRGEWYKMSDSMFEETNLIESKLQSLLDNPDMLKTYLRSKLRQELIDVNTNNTIYTDMTKKEMKELKFNSQKNFLTGYIAAFLSQKNFKKANVTVVKDFILKNINKSEDGTKKSQDDEEYVPIKLIREEFASLVDTIFKPVSVKVKGTKRPLKMLHKICPDEFLREHRAITELPTIYKQLVEEKSNEH